jgi:hypothetical protein
MPGTSRARWKPAALRGTRSNRDGARASKAHEEFLPYAHERIQPMANPGALDDDSVSRVRREMRGRGFALVHTPLDFESGMAPEQKSVRPSSSGWTETSARRSPARLSAASGLAPKVSNLRRGHVATTT